jgi:YgiT-type zinc finger domain-containing protein
MKCLLCKDGNTVPGMIAVTLTRGDCKMVFRNVPSMKCRDCSEEYVNEETSSLLLDIANESVKKGEGSFVRDFQKVKGSE